MAMLDYAVVFVAGSVESLLCFRVWAEAQGESVRYHSVDDRERDVYQVKAPMSFQVLLLQAAQVHCRVDVA